MISKYWITDASKWDLAAIDYRVLKTVGIPTLHYYGTVEIEGLVDDPERIGLYPYSDEGSDIEAGLGSLHRAESGGL